MSSNVRDQATTMSLFFLLHFVHFTLDVSKKNIVNASFVTLTSNFYMHMQLNFYAH